MKRLVVFNLSEDEFNKKLKWHCLTHPNAKVCLGECKVKSVLSLFGKRHVMEIIRILLINQKMRFKDFMNGLDISPKTLTSRLRELERFNLVKRKTFPEIPPKVVYSLTEPGRDLEGVFESISIWVKKWSGA